MSPSPDVIAALADTLFPATDDAPSGADVVPERLDDLLASMDPEDVKQLAIGVALLEAGAVPLHRRRFTQLSERDRARYLVGWRQSRFAFRRNLYRALRNLVTNLYYSDPRSWPAIGYAGTQVGGAS